ncbi:alanine--tRNA ligase [Bartonella quintana]|uniref:Alanine--tRNA ligase n=3 Tax=Bartonella quintana TaxID=803 RepID=SYA_BARQU|nr:alanine--tRNA ligase [Bartonella quintana]Q6FZF1.1 RecName: Full=Alanine--tRNA ligase; AltName: Full=Alanyl-tRNA synthetase; Short=AlaRS [Bartonella quintana str. Toulouse]ETS13199.1 alanyl-tRNA synthetase [Bartonella quintana BQ2-D70]ETS14144.1 alanyl-tRNA synthetase [Bartonella quintana JK 73rel]ETS15831.1 alanyl-tRNA synthetase [Bartonella quintana JK 73]ETS17834.1 alanyl-tRNA synthetase [Bartonella quintana JK 7]ETS18663.1 alanyl-tRNA synthetase [Bartonella quintana JK 12]
MNSVNSIRSTFLDYFHLNGHKVLSSSPLVPRNDPTLMFTNAGMVQFKNVFTGLEQRPCKQATTAQKCVRVGGKHNDLDNVGYTARHHTFFEMLGNFSFSDYFKEEAIFLSWNLLTKEFCLPKDKLLVTVYHSDDVAAELWRKISNLSDEKIVRIATVDNFWAMGETGPCGPCSEIFYDHGDEIWGGPPGSANEGGDRFIEIWNLVFMQYEQVSKEERVELPHPSIDTGMGLERIAAVLQGVHDNYDIDLFRALIGASQEITGVEATGDFIASHRVISDHLRSCAFLIADGVLPSNEGRGYVLRRIMRRAMRHAHFLGVKEPLMWRLLPVLVREMGQAYPELVRAESLISETLKLEEMRFRKTLERGLGLLNEASSNLKEGDHFNGEIAFKLYDTYGFPLDLTQDALRCRGISVDVDAFDKAMQRQKTEARANWSGSGEAVTETIWFAVRDRVGATEFLGYEIEKAEGIITALICDGKVVDHISSGQKAIIVVNQTPFYGESGGQIGDSGIISSGCFVFEVHDTQKKSNGVFIHIGEVKSGQAKTFECVELTVDVVRRQKIRANHSATHLLHEALRQILGPHVTQKGSLVLPDRLRFDFSHPKSVSSEELKKIEDLANDIVLQNSEVTTHLMALDDAISEGAMALFGEKYGDEVRVVSMGNPLEPEGLKKRWSIELCGGTHVERTGDIGLIHIVSESSVAAGVRRIEALTGTAARLYFNRQDERIREISSLLKTVPADVGERVSNLLHEYNRLSQACIELRKKIILSGNTIKNNQEDITIINGISFMGRVVRNILPRDLKALVDDGKKQIGSGVVAFISVAENGKGSAVVGVTNDLTDKLNAVNLIHILSDVLGGKGGGGRPDMAQSGGPEGDKAVGALAALRASLEKI